MRHTITLFLIESRAGREVIQGLFAARERKAFLKRLGWEPRMRTLRLAEERYY